MTGQSTAQTRRALISIALLVYTLTPTTCLMAASDKSQIPYAQAVELIASHNPEEQQQALEALSKSTHPQASRFLLELIQSPDTNGVLKIDAANALGMRGDRTVVPELITALEKDFTKRTGIWAGLIPALGNIGDTKAIPVLLKALNNQNEDWLGREMAARALGQIGSNTAVPDLLEAVWMVDTRYEAIVALASIRDVRAASIFIDALNDSEDIEIVQAAERGLEKLGDEAINEMIESFLITHPEHSDTIKRVRLCQLLGNSRVPSAVDALKKALRQESDPEVKDCITLVLSEASTGKEK